MSLVPEIKFTSLHSALSAHAQATGLDSFLLEAGLPGRGAGRAGRAKNADPSVTDINFLHLKFPTEFS